jgi:hypothetical protein
MSKISSKALFFTSSVFYFIAAGIGIDTVAGDGFRVLGVLCLLLGILWHFKEKRITKSQHQ